jgi:hypothetical protein
VPKPSKPNSTPERPKGSPASESTEGRAKRGKGRPTSYRPEFAVQAEKLCALGATDDDLADFFETSTRTIYRWQTQFEEFCQALRAGKAPADERVERSLFHRAVGYRHEAVKIFMPAGAKEPVYAEYVEQVPPDTTAAIFWLKNRRPDLWRDRVQNEHSGPDGGPIQTSSKLDISGLSDEQLKALAAIKVE